VPLRSAVNEVTRRAYIRECDNAVQRWNRQIAEAGHDFRLSLPSPRFRRAIGIWAGVPSDPQGRPVSGEAWRARQYEWLPSEADRDFVKALMRPVTDPGKMAGWIAPPERGINDLPVDYEYVRL
jgi:benzoyl-CoA 2,3-dioxygenase component B